MSNQIEEIKARIDIVDLVSETVKLRRSGRSYSGFCPFHDNKNTPAFAVFPDSGTWRCFGQCAEGGDIYKFVMKKEGWDFPEALRYLADRAGVTLRKLTPLEQEQREANERLRDLLEDAATFFRHHLQNTPAGQKAAEYLKKRGLTEKVIEEWGLGYAPQSWDACLKHLASNGYSEEDMVKAGMVSQRDSGGIYDRFRHRVTFPIRDETGRMAGFGARILNPDDVPKFLNSPQTELFDKSRILYGMDKARRTIRAEDQAVIVEGYLDVIALHQHGYANAVSPMGTALTEHQLQLIKRRTRNIVLALDADAAGDKATLRGLEVARKTMDREQEIGFNARGLLRQEARLQADIRVTSLPEGMDPDDVVNEAPESWKEILAAAKPVVIHVMETLAADQDLDDPKVKSEIAREVLPLIEDVPSPIERDTYRQRLARLLRVDERALQNEARRQPPPRTRPRTRRAAQPPSPALTDIQKRPAPVQNPAFAGTQELELFCLGVLMRFPDMAYRVDRALQKNQLARLSRLDFHNEGHRELLTLILDSIDQDFDNPLQVILGSLPLNLMDLADRILHSTEKIDTNTDRILEDLIRAVLDIRKKNTHQEIANLRHLMKEAQENGDMIKREYQETMVQHTTNLVRLDRALQQTKDRTILKN
jgi:DNA primase